MDKSVTVYRRYKMFKELYKKVCCLQ
jgi:ribosomal protein S17